MIWINTWYIPLLNPFVLPKKLHFHRTFKTRLQGWWHCSGFLSSKRSPKKPMVGCWIFDASKRLLQPVPQRFCCEKKWRILKFLTGKLTKFSWKSMIGRCISCWNSPFVGDIRSFSVVFFWYQKCQKALRSNLARKCSISRYWIALQLYYFCHTKTGCCRIFPCLDGAVGSSRLGRLCSISRFIHCFLAIVAAKIEAKMWGKTMFKGSLCQQNAKLVGGWTNPFGKY